MDGWMGGWMDGGWMDDGWLDVSSFHQGKMGGARTSRGLGSTWVF